MRTYLTFGAVFPAVPTHGPAQLSVNELIRAPLRPKYRFTELECCHERGERRQEWRYHRDYVS